jgi:hypothetical protein
MKKLINNTVRKERRQRFWVSFLFCFILCLFILLVISPLTGLSQSFGEGHDGYIQLARSIVAGYGYVFEENGPPVFHRPPMYPLFLVPIALFPEYMQRYVLVFAQSVLVGFIGVMIFKIAGRLFNRSTASVALLLFLINPWVYWNAKNPMTPVLQTALYLLFVYSVAMEMLHILNLRPERRKPGLLFRGLVIGAAGGALSLTHAAMLPVVLICVLSLLIAAIFKKTERLLTATAAALITVCFIAPWTYRNWVVFGRFIPVSGGGGLAYFIGNVHWNCIEPQPQRQGESFIDASLRVLGIDGTKETHINWLGFKDIKYEELANRKMAEHIKNHPGLFVRKVILNAIEYYFPAFTKPFLAIKTVTAEQWALSIFHLLLWLAAAVGIFYNRQRGLLLLAGIFIYAVWFFPFTTFVGHSLYSFGTMPFLCIIAAAGVVCFFSGEQRSFGKRKEVFGCYGI